jgi:hypothetical protein
MSSYINKYGEIQWNNGFWMGFSCGITTATILVMVLRRN